MKITAIAFGLAVANGLLGVVVTGHLLARVERIEARLAAGTTDVARAPKDQARVEVR